MLSVSPVVDPNLNDLNGTSGSKPMMDPVNGRDVVLDCDPNRGPGMEVDPVVNRVDL